MWSHQNRPGSLLSPKRLAHQLELTQCSLLSCCCLLSALLSLRIDIDANIYIQQYSRPITDLIYLRNHLNYPLCDVFDVECRQSKGESYEIKHWTRFFNQAPVTDWLSALGSIAVCICVAYNQCRHSHSSNQRLVVQRLRTLQQKKEAQAKASRRDIALLLEKGKLETARIKVETSAFSGELQAIFAS